VVFTGVFTTESFVLHRLTVQGEYKAHIHWEDDTPNKEVRSDTYFTRVRQHNNQWAWSSPIWVGNKQDRAL